MLFIRKIDVPQYLRSSALFVNAFQDLEDDDHSNADMTIEIPADCLKNSSEVCDERDLRALLLTTRFWLVPEVIENCNDLYSFASRNKEAFDLVALEFGKDFPFLVKLSSALQLKPNLTAIECAVQAGMLGLVKYFRSRGAPFDPGSPGLFTALAAENGHLDCLQYAVENGFPLTYETSSLAAREGHLHCLQYAYEHGAAIRSGALENAIRKGHLDCVSYLLGTQVLQAAQIAKFCDIAARIGRIDILACLFREGCAPTVDVANCAAAFGHLECLQFLYENGCPLSSDTLYTAVHCGSLRCVKYLHSMGCPWDAETAHIRHFSRATIARGREIDIPADQLISTFMYAVENGCPVTSRTLSSAAHLKSVEFVEYLHGRGVALDAIAFRTAVLRGAVAVMLYFLNHGYQASIEDAYAAVRTDFLEGMQCLDEHGVEWVSTVASLAVNSDKARILRFLLDRGCEVSPDVVLMAAQLKNAACLQCLHAHGVPLIEDVVTMAVTSNSVDCLQFALSQGCAVGADAVLPAAFKGHLQCLMLLHEHGVPITHGVVRAACATKKFDCAAYAVIHGCEELGPELCAAAAALKATRQLEILRQQGIQWDISACLGAIRNHSFECLKYAVKNGCPGDYTLLLPEAALRRRCDMLKWLHKKRVPWDTRTTAAAVQSDDVECLQYAIQRQCPYDVPAEVLRKAPRCWGYMTERGHGIVQRALRRKQGRVPTVTATEAAAQQQDAVGTELEHCEILDKK